MPVGISYRAMLAAAGSSAAADAYIVNSFSPPVVADFAGVLNSGTEYYRVGGSDSTFDSMFTFSRSGLATMTDSDGNLKWAPHNLLTKPSEDLTTYTTSGSPVVTHNTGITGPTGTGITASTTIEDDSAAAYEFIIGSNTTPTGGVTYTLAWFLKKSAQTNYMEFQAQMFDTTHTAILCVRPSDGASNVREGTSDSSSVTSWDSNWWLCELTVTPTSGDTGGFRIFPAASTDGTNGTISASLTGTIEVTGVHFYRSDLGGMTDNPSTASSYVPVPSTSNVFLARRNHYRYNGSTYDNKGILLESEARTNLITSSDDMSGWTTSNMTVAKNQTGADGVANSAHSLTATSGSATVLTTITAASNPHVYSALVKRVTGTGTIEMTVNGGTNWINVTSLINSSEFIQVGTGAGTTVTNPQVGFRITTSGDAIAVQVNQLEQTSGQFSSPIPTSGATATRAAETLTIPWANTSWSDTADSYQMQGEVSYADQNDGVEVGLFNWYASGNDQWTAWLDSDRGTGGIQYRLRDGATSTQDILSSGSAFTPGINKAYNIASRITETGPAFNAALNGTSFTVNTGTPDLPLFSGSNPDIKLGTVDVAADNGHFGTIALFRQWDDDIGDTGIESATS